MGVVTRADSPHYWLNLERPGRRVLRESTKIPVAAATPEQVKANKVLAQQVYAVRMSELARHRHGLATLPEMRFLAWAAWYAEHKTSQKASANRERSALVKLRSFFAKFTLAQIDRDAVSEYLTWRTATVDPSTANREIDTLKDMLTTAVPKYLAVSPLLGMKRLRVKRRGMRILTLAEFRRLKTAIQKHTIVKLDPSEGWALFVVAVDTFMRLGDLVALTPDQVYRDHIHVEDPKIGPYDVTLSPRARRALEAPVHLAADEPALDDAREVCAERPLRGRDGHRGSLRARVDATFRRLNVADAAVALAGDRAMSLCVSRATGHPGVSCSLSRCRCSR